MNDTENELRKTDEPVQELLVEMVEEVLVEEKRSKNKPKVLQISKTSRRKNLKPKKQLGMKTTVMRKIGNDHLNGKMLKWLGRFTLSYEFAEREITDELEAITKALESNNL